MRLTRVADIFSPGWRVFRSCVASQTGTLDESILQHSKSASPLFIHCTGAIPANERRVDAVFVAVSTGGTLAGMGRFFREKSPATRMIGVDAKGSVVFGGQLVNAGSPVSVQRNNQTLLPATLTKSTC